MTQTLKLLMAQIDPKVGAIEANADKIKAIINDHQNTHDLIVFPELIICGYPPEDLLFREAFRLRVERALVMLEALTDDCHVIIGHPWYENNQCFNAASVFYKGQRVALYFKQKLPNYAVFDERRYFTPGPAQASVLEIKGHRLGLCICEDLWQDGPVDLNIAAGVKTIICINSSPFDYEKPILRERLLNRIAKKGLSVIYTNQTGGQDELVFDGQSLAIDCQGTIAARAPAFEEALLTLTMTNQTIQSTVTPALDEIALIYKALVCGTRDYVAKNGFPGVLLGLSGGIDSALTLAVAVDALGADKVEALMMPSRYTASISNEDAEAELKILGVKGTMLSIEPVFKAFLNTLSPCFSGLAVDITEENLQARIRGSLLMALSNKSGKMVLTTSNKSETAVGYATLYGDMAGGFSVLKDVLKTQVYALAAWRNSLGEEVIPQRVISRPPSAELAENQRDQDSLPDYDILDGIIKAYMEQNKSELDLFEAGYKKDDIERVIRLIKRNEYKRRQSAPGIKISPRAFGRDWRYPITSGF